MGAAIIGLVGATLGTLITLLSANLSERRQARRERATWRRDKRIAAYEGALRHLLRAANLRSEFVANEGAILKKEHQREWFDDLIQAQFWLHTASRYCEPEQMAFIVDAADLLNTHIERLLSSQSFNAKGFSIWEVLNRCIAVVTQSERPGGLVALVNTYPGELVQHSSLFSNIRMEEGLPAANVRFGFESSTNEPPS